VIEDEPTAFLAQFNLKNVFAGGCEAYLVKPIDTREFTLPNQLDQKRQFDAYSYR
jgi:hypothetical protein